MMYRNIDLHDDFIIQPCFNGVRVVKPSDENYYAASKNSIKELLKLPINIYFQLPGGELMLNCNKQDLSRS